MENMNEKMDMMNMRMDMMNMKMDMMHMQGNSEPEDNAGVKESKLVGRWKLTSYTIGSTDQKYKGWVEFHKKARVHDDYIKPFYMTFQKADGTGVDENGSWWSVIDDKLLFPYNVILGLDIFEVALDGKALTLKCTSGTGTSTKTTELKFEKL